MGIRGILRYLKGLDLRHFIAGALVGLLWCAVPFFYGARGSLQYVVVFVLLLCVSALLLFRLFSLRAVRVTLTDALAGVYMLYGLASVVFVRDTLADPVWLWEWAGLLLLYVLVRSLTQESTRILLLFVVVSGVLQASVGLSQLWGILPSKHPVFDLTGSFLNPGPLGGYLAVSVAVAVGLCVRSPAPRGATRWLLVGAALLMGYVCFRSDSRAAWLSVAVVLGWLAMRITFHQPTLQITRNQFCHCKLYVSVCMGVLVLLSAVLLYGYRRDSADARMFIWKVSATMIAESPLLGHGAGSYPSGYMLAQGAYFECHPDSRFAVAADNNFVAYNEYLHLVCEQGVVGLLLLLAVFLSALGSATVSGREGGTAKCALVALLVFSCFSYPASVLPLKMFFVLSVGMLPGRELWRMTFRGKAPGTLLSLLLLGLFIFSAMHYGRFHRAYATLGGMLEGEPEAMAQGKEDFPEFRYDTEYVLNHAQILFVHHDYQQSLNPLRQAAALCPSSTVYCHLGEALQRTGHYQEAERAYMQAALMTPGFITPPYQLFGLYLETGDTTRADSMAALILHKRLKTESPRVQAMRKEVEVHTLRK